MTTKLITSFLVLAILISPFGFSLASAQAQTITAQPESSPVFNRNLRMGTKNNDVRQLQKILSTDPDIYPDGSVTGYFGSLTKEAVKRFQKKNLVAVSASEYGIVGSKTREKLNAIIRNGVVLNVKIFWGRTESLNQAQLDSENTQATNEENLAVAADGCVNLPKENFAGLITGNNGISMQLIKEIRWEANDNILENSTSTIKWESEIFGGDDGISARIKIKPLNEASKMTLSFPELNWQSDISLFDLLEQKRIEKNIKPGYGATILISKLKQPPADKIISLNDPDHPLNGGFETGNFTGWETFGHPLTTIINNKIDTYEGNYVAKIEIPCANFYNLAKIRTSSIALEKDGEYEAQAYLKTDANIKLARMMVENWGKGNIKILENSDQLAANQPYTKLKIKFRVENDNTIVKVKIQARNEIGKKAVLFADGISINLIGKPLTEQKPNIVLFLTDDQRWDTIGNEGINAEIKQKYGRPVMPIVEERIVNKGVLFNNSFVSTPLCCPERASLLSGGFYAKNTGVLSLLLPNGGAQKFQDTDSLAVQLQKVGYDTALIGKYLNGYAAMHPYIPPGWTTFVANDNQKSWYDYKTTIGSSSSTASSVGITEERTEYITDLQRDKALEFIDQHGDSPFFMELSFNAPHNPATPLPEDASLFSDYVYQGRAYNEENISDKPTWVKKKMSEGQNELEFDRNQLRSLQAVDRAIGAVMDKIDAMGKSNQTIFIFTSDNGYLWGEHGLFGKQIPYDESIRVPFAIRAPGVSQKTSPEMIVSNLDIGPTIFELTGIQKTTDGTSIVPLLKNSVVPSWRKDFLIDHYIGWLESDTRTGTKTWAGIRTTDDKYVEYANGEKEFYDLIKDPYEKENGYGAPEYQSRINYLASSLRSNKGLAMTTFLTPNGVVGQNYKYQLKAWGGKEPYKWSIVNGKLPRGLLLDSATGIISGVPLISTQKKNKVSIKVESQAIATQTGKLQEFIYGFDFLIRKPTTTMQAIDTETSPVSLISTETITSTSAKIRIKSNTGTKAQVEYDNDPDFENYPRMSKSIRLSGKKDGVIQLTDLADNTVYYYRVLFDDKAETASDWFNFKTLRK